MNKFNLDEVCTNFKTLQELHNTYENDFYNVLAVIMPEFKPEMFLALSLISKIKYKNQLVKNVVEIESGNFLDKYYFLLKFKNGKMVYINTNTEKCEIFKKSLKNTNDGLKAKK